MEKHSLFAVTTLIATTLLAVAVFAISMAGDDNPGIFISEVCPHNDDVIYDSVGFYHDYIKIYNESSSVVSLDGYALSDDKTKLDKYVFPDVDVEPEGSILIWADTRPLFEHRLTDEDALYTGFGLRDHEYLYLSNPDGAIIDSLRLPAMKPSRSLLRAGVNDKGEEGTPSEMETQPPAVSEFVSPPTFSIASGFYAAPFFLDVAGEGNTVYYTVDGSDPYTMGTEYSDPIPVIDRSVLPDYYSTLGPVSAVAEQYYPSNPVSKCTVIRAVSKDSDGTFSNETIGVYFVGEDIKNACEGVYTVSIVSDTDGLFSSKNGIYVAGHIWEMNNEKAEDKGIDKHIAPANYNMRGKGWKRNARLTLFDPSGVCLYDENDRISVRGGFARSFLQKNFALSPRRTGERVFDGFMSDTGDSYVLRAGSYDDAFQTNIRDPLNSKIAINMNVAAQRSVCCQVFLNGEYWGCYNLQEKPDESFIQAKYKVPADNVNLIKNFISESGISGDLGQYKQLLDFIHLNDLKDPDRYARFCEMVDIDNFIDYYCAEIYFANDDAYVGNVALWRSRNKGYTPYEDGKWRFILFDTDCTDGYYANVASSDSFTEENWNGTTPLNETFFSNLVKNAEFRDKFTARFTQLLQSDFSYERIEPILDEMEQTYLRPMVMSIRRYNDPQFTGDQYRGRVNVVRDFFRDRNGYIYKYMMQHMSEQDND